MARLPKKLYRGRSAATRSGVVLVAVVVVFTIALALFGIWAHAAIAHDRQLQNEPLRLQAARLAEAGVRRAILRRAADPQYSEETWAVSANLLGGDRAAAVRIHIEPSADASVFSVQARAEFPTGTPRRAQVTRQIEVPSSSFGN